MRQKTCGQGTTVSKMIHTQDLDGKWEVLTYFQSILFNLRSPKMKCCRPQKELVTWIYENYYATLFNTCSGIFKMYFKFWKGQESLASLRKEAVRRRLYNPACCGLQELSLQWVWGGLLFRKSNTGRWRDLGRGQKAEPSDSVTVIKEPQTD